MSVVLGSGPDRTTSHFLIKTTLISFLAYYTECSITKLFLYSHGLHYYFFISILHFLNIHCSRVAVCRPIVLSIKRIYHHQTVSLVDVTQSLDNNNSSPKFIWSAQPRCWPRPIN